MEYTFLILSAITIVISLLCVRANNSHFVFKPIYSLFFLVSIILSVTYVASDFFTDNGVDESVIYHLKYGLEGSGFAEYKFQIVYGAVAIVIAVLLSIIVHRNKTHTKKSLRADFYTFLFIIASIIINPTTQDVYSLYFSEHPIHVTITPLPIISDSLGEFVAKQHREKAIDSTYIKLKNGDNSGLYNYYQIPEIRRIAGVESKNIVVIYMESFERTYLNEKAFPGLTPNLSKLEKRATSFTNIKQVYCTKWTIAGIVAGQSGIPLFSTTHANSMSGVDEFLPSAKSLGDLLNEQDYYLTFMGGADQTFAGKGRYFKSHGFDEVLGRDELLRHIDDPDYRNGWGLYDDDLLELSLKKYEELMDNQERFGLFILTSDTHHPHGHASKSVSDITYKNGNNTMLNVVKSSDKLIGDFVHRLENHPCFENTVIVILSDHLAMKNGAYEELEKQKRSNLLMVIDGESASRVSRPGSVLDFGSTILPFIGYRGNIGLGRDLQDPNTTTSELAAIQKYRNLKKWRPSIEKFWDFPTINSDISFDTATDNIKIGTRSFKFPLLIEIDKDLNTKMKFDFNNSSDEKKLIDYVAEIDDANRYILVERRGGAFIARGGKLGHVAFRKTVSDSLVISLEEVKTLF